ncbi:DUF5695 domain-containing protein [Microlunatus panaciterrae]|uniref:Uncharacterized protein n=1 Tax=Microlunatus panaciterrae TaxID=400768 RepID=A0ABS2RHS6_9ACTN|nr:hypothetical protein [Microlunatus panaciterrae]MBM7798565.1 hypothetical protein [Microlunatus panaciterrae]
MTDHAITLPVGPGTVLLDPNDGAPLQFVDPDAADRRFLLDETTDAFHSSEHRWGSGFVITNVGSTRWSQPAERRLDGPGVQLTYPLLDTLTLTVTRTGGERLLERYELTNTGAAPLVVTSLGINTPFRDLYESAATSLAQAVHAHVWTGGADAWVWAQPMSGTGRSLGLIVRSGALWSYSVESRNQNSSSNVRGHLLLQATDLARNSTAFGGQPPIEIASGESWLLEWEVGFFASREAFLAASTPQLTVDRLYAEVGQQITVLGNTAGLRVDGEASVEREGERVAVTGTQHGAVHLSTDSAQTAVLFHSPLPDLVRRRVRFILDQHRPTERPLPYRYAFVPYDTATGLTQTTNGWADWSDGAERVAMPALLQEARRRGWVDSPGEVDEALVGFADFARNLLLDESAAPRWGSTVKAPVRIYNSPWLAHFFATQHDHGGADDDLDLAARILERSFELGAGEHLSIGHPEALVLVTERLLEAGQADRATGLRDLLVQQAAHFAKITVNLPSHEVNYEQSMVAPLVTLYAVAEQLEGQDRFLGPLDQAVRWLRAFGGPQPHIRLNEIGIRHWDGYWFGRDRQWGDIFPHHWSVLTAVALRQLPTTMRTAESDSAAREIFHANLINIFADGSATCAFTVPSAVDGRPGYRADPLANDQDWPLTLWLRQLESGDV